MLWLAALLACAGAAGAQGYPNKAIRLIVPYPPGGSTDISARLLSQGLGAAFGQPVVVDNRGGGNTLLGSEALVKSPADGYAIELVTNAHTIIPNLVKVPYDPIRDFAPIGTVIATQQIMAVNPGVAANNLKEFIALLKSRPGQVNYGNSGNGTNNHINAELFQLKTGTKMQAIPYKGSGPGVAALVAGEIQMFMNNPLPMVGQYKAGKIRVLAISGEKRNAALPDVPTFAEAGLPGYDASGWQGILAPARTPRPVIERVARELSGVLNKPEVVDVLVKSGAEPYISTPEAFAELIRRSMKDSADTIKFANIKLDE